MRRARGCLKPAVNSGGRSPLTLEERVARGTISRLTILRLPPSRPHCSTHKHKTNMADEDLNLYDEIEIEDCFYDETLQIYHHPCPCGDRFEISIYNMRDGEDIARCPSCSLMIRIIFDQVSAKGEGGGRPWEEQRGTSRG